MVRESVNKTPLKRSVRCSWLEGLLKTLTCELLMVLESVNRTPLKRSVKCWQPHCLLNTSLWTGKVCSCWFWGLLLKLVKWFIMSQFTVRVSSSLLVLKRSASSILFLDLQKLSINTLLFCGPLFWSPLIRNGSEFFGVLECTREVGQVLVSQKSSVGSCIIVLLISAILCYCVICFFLFLFCFVLSLNISFYSSVIK